MKPTDEEIEEPSDVPAPEISDFEDAQQVADKLPAYQEFVREQKLNEVWRLTFSNFQLTYKNYDTNASKSNGGNLHRRRRSSRGDCQ